MAAHLSFFVPSLVVAEAQAHKTYEAFQPRLVEEGYKMQAVSRYFLH